MRPKVTTAEEVQNVLSVACTGHGASVAFVDREGRVRASVLERWAGIKQVLLFSADEYHDILVEPKSDLDKKINEVLVRGSGGVPRARVFEETLQPWLSWFLAELGLTREDIDLFVASPSYFATCYARLGLRLNDWFSRAHIHNMTEHHAVHQRQAFWQSGFDEAAVLTLDTCGETLERLGGRQLSGTISVMRSDGTQETLSELLYPESSAGLYYDSATLHLGFRQGHEGKTMGLAPYGRPALFERIAPRLELHADGSFAFMPLSEFEALIEAYVPVRAPKEDITPEHEDVAFAVQALTERIVANAFRAALELSGKMKLAYAGGVALNSVANEIAYQTARPEALYVAPNAGDPGHALGCALLGAYELVKFPHARREVPEYLGPRYPEAAITRALARAESCHVTRPERLPELVARLLANGYIVARFAGGSEFGPRALGNRSILCDPRPRGMKDYLNLRVKHREAFRPFAPVVLESEAPRWFDLDQHSPYMLRVVSTRPEVRELIPAVVHVDGTARVQTLRRAENPGLYAIIEAFGAQTQVPLLLNTSFNVDGKPIVEHPEEAVTCFNSTAIDVLVLEGHLLTREPLAQYLQTARHVP